MKKGDDHKTICPTCQGTGYVTPYQPPKPGPTAVTGGVHNGLCSCDGPPHPYSPGWCPSIGPT